MSHHAQRKHVKKSRGAKGNGISKKRANDGQRPKKVSDEVLLGEQPFPKSLSDN